MRRATPIFVIVLFALHATGCAKLRSVTINEQQAATAAQILNVTAEVVNTLQTTMLGVCHSTEGLAIYQSTTRAQAEGRFARIRVVCDRAFAGFGALRASHEAAWDIVDGLQSTSDIGRLTALARAVAELQRGVRLVQEAWAQAQEELDNIVSDDDQTAHEPPAGDDAGSVPATPEEEGETDGNS